VFAFGDGIEALVSRLPLPGTDAAASLPSG
jgi:hypothetical protein